MESNQSKNTISYDVFLKYKDLSVIPIENLNIPNITIPSHLTNAKKFVDDTLTVNIRQLFNSLTPDNMETVKTELRNVIITKAKSSKMIDEISQEILMNFIISKQNISNYMYLLNSIYNVCVILTTDIADTTHTPEKSTSITIGNSFLKKCKDLIFKNINEETVRMLASLDQDDPDELDKYNREREKNINLLHTIYCLYGQRSTRNIKLTAMQLHPLTSEIFENHKKCVLAMTKLGNPYKNETCLNEDEYEILRKMAIIYAEQLYILMTKGKTDFPKDQSKIGEKTMTGLFDRFVHEVIPTITEPYLVSKCDTLVKD